MDHRDVLGNHNHDKNGFARFECSSLLLLAPHEQRFTDAATIVITTDRLESKCVSAGKTLRVF
jgi:hypothetical protein